MPRFEPLPFALAIALALHPASPVRGQEDDARSATEKRGASQDQGPGRLLRARGSSWVWFVDSFGTRHRIASTEILRKWWAAGPKVEEVSQSELGKLRTGEEIDYGANPYTYVVSRDSRPSSVGNDPLSGQLRDLLRGGVVPSANPAPTPASAAPPSPEATPRPAASKPPPTPAAVQEATLVITSEPKGVAVLRPSDGHRYGETPLSIKLSPGTHNLSFMAKGFLRVRKKVTLAPGETRDLDVKLKPVPGQDSAAQATFQTVRMQWVALGEVEVLLRPGAGGFSPGLTQVFRLSLPGRMDTCLPSPAGDRAAGLETGRALWLLTFPREGTASLRELALPDTFKEASLPAWTSDRDLLLSDATDQERLLLDTDALTLKKPRGGVVPRTVDPKARTWLSKDTFSSRPEALKAFSSRDVPGHAGKVAGLALSSDGRLLVGVARDNPRRLLLMSMASGAVVPLPEPGEDLGEASLSWLSGDRILVSAPGKGCFVLSLEATAPRTVLEMAQTLVTAGQTDEAIKMLDRLVKHYPGSPEAQGLGDLRAKLSRKAEASRAGDGLKQARDLVARGQYKAAVELLKKIAALTEAPEAAEARTLLMEVETTMAEVDLRAAQAAEAKAPESALPLYEAVVQTAPPAVKEKAQKALAELNRKLATARAASTRHEIDEALARAAKARAAGDLGHARSILDEAARLHPSATAITNQLAEVTELLRKEKDREDRARRAVDHYSRALSLAHRGLFAEAAEAAGAALKEDPTHQPSQKLLAELSSTALDRARQATATTTAPTSPAPAPVATPAAAVSPAPVATPVAAASPVTTATAGGSLALGPADLGLATGAAWTYGLGKGNLTRRIVGQVAVLKEVGWLVHDRVELPGASAVDRFGVWVPRPAGLFAVARAFSEEGPFRPIRPPEMLARFPLSAGSAWVTHRGHVQVSSAQPVTTPAGSFSGVLALEEAVRHVDPLDASAKLLSYRDLYAAGVGLVRRSLARATGPDRPILELTAFTAGRPTSEAATPATTAAPDAAARGLREIRIDISSPRAPSASAAASPDAAAPDSEQPADTESPAAGPSSEEEELLKEKGETHFQAARDQLTKRFPIQARTEIEAALSFDPSNKSYLDLKRQILGALRVHAPYRPGTFLLGQNLAEFLTAFGAPDRIEPTTAEVFVDRFSIPYDTILTYRGGPAGAPPTEREREASADAEEIKPVAAVQMARWRVYVKSGRVVARQVDYRGDFNRASFPAISQRVTNEIVSRPHLEKDGALKNTRVLDFDFGVAHVRTLVLALPHRKYNAASGYVLEPARGIKDYRIVRALTFVDPETDEAP